MSEEEEEAADEEEEELEGLVAEVGGWQRVRWRREYPAQSAVPAGAAEGRTYNAGRCIPLS